MSEILKVKEENIYYSKNPSTGLIEARDRLTDKVVAYQDVLDDVALSDTGLVEIARPDGQTVMISKGIDPSSNFENNRRFRYSKVLGDLIVEQILEGMTMTKICKQNGFPSYSVLCRWRLEHEDFSNAIEAARAFRAERFHDELVDELDELDDLSKDEVQAKKLKLDNLKWLTEKNDHKRYGAGKKQEGANVGEASIKIVVNTGINRDNEDNDVIVITNED